MVSSLAPINFGQPVQEDFGDSILSGKKYFQQSQQADQNLAAGAQDMQMNSQKIDQNDFSTHLRNLTVMNKLLKQVKSTPPDRREQFISSLDNRMLQSIGVTPQDVAQTPRDDQGLDDLIAQTDAAIEAGNQHSELQQNRVQSTTKFKNGAVQQILSGGGIRVLDPSGKVVTGEEARKVIDEANQYEIGNSTQKSGGMADARNKSDQSYAGGISYNKKTGELDATIDKGAAAKEAEALGAGRGKNIADNEGSAVKADKISQNLLDNIAEARKIIPSATSSGIGALADAGGRLIGVTSESAKNAAKLETLAGWMVANVPRMEGPQSDKDVESYKTMAGRVGNRDIPKEERLAALDILESLQKKYSERNKANIGGSGGEVTATGIASDSKSKKLTYDPKTGTFH